MLSQTCASKLVVFVTKKLCHDQIFLPNIKENKLLIPIIEARLRTDKNYERKSIKVGYKKHNDLNLIFNRHFCATSHHVNARRDTLHLPCFTRFSSRLSSGSNAKETITTLDSFNGISESNWPSLSTYTYLTSPRVSSIRSIGCETCTYDLELNPDK